MDIKIQKNNNNCVGLYKWRSSAKLTTEKCNQNPINAQIFNYQKGGWGERESGEEVKKTLMSECGRVVKNDVNKVTKLNLFHGNVGDHVRNKPKNKQEELSSLTTKRKGRKSSLRGTQNTTLFLSPSQF